MPLSKLLKEKYNISEEESREASSVLIGFFKELQKIDTRLEQEKLIENESNNKVKLYDRNNKS